MGTTTMFGAARFFLLWVSLLTLDGATTAANKVEFYPFGVQSGIDEEVRSSFAVSMVYDDNSKEIVITGGTYSNYFSPGSPVHQHQPSQTDSDCFVAILKLPETDKAPRMNKKTGALKVDVGQPEWIRRKQFGNKEISEFCSGIQVGPFSNMYIIGHSGEGGLLQDLLPYGSIHQSVYGMVLEMNDDVNLWGGQLLHSSQVQYPVQIATDSSFKEIFVASLFTDADPANVLVDDATNGRVYRGGQDLSATGYTSPRYGRRFSVRIQSMYNSRDDEEVTDATFLVGNSTGVPETVAPKWSRDFGTSSMDPVEVSGLLYVEPSTLIMAGYTRGSGPSFGYTDTPTDTTLDSFVTKLNPETGELVTTKRIFSVLKRSDDRILGICHHADENGSFLFAVGMTGGLFGDLYLPEGYPYDEGGNDAFIVKMDLNTMAVVWSRQIGAFKANRPQFNDPHQIHGLACTVTSDGEHVYMAGDIKDGAILSIKGESEFTSAGADDIFVAQFRSGDGTLQYARQIGTPEDDALAQGNSLATDGDGNLIVLGNTRGGLFRSKANGGVSDIFTLTVGRISGEHVGVSGTIVDKKVPTEDERESHGDDFVPDSYSNTEPSPADREKAKKFIAIGIVVGLSISIIGIALIICRFRKNRTVRNSITDKLKEMDAVDVVLEASSVRGWQAVLKEKGLGDSLDYPQDQPLRQHGSGGYGLPWGSGEVEDSSSLTSSLVAQAAPREIDDSHSLLSRNNSLCVLGDEGLSSEGGLRAEDPLYSGFGTHDEDPYDEVYGMLSEANERLMRQNKSRPSTGLMPNSSTDDFSVRSLDQMYDSEML